jgi:hypothetical protein
VFTAPEVEGSFAAETGSSAATGTKLSVLVDRLILQLATLVINQRLITKATNSVPSRPIPSVNI